VSFGFFGRNERHVRLPPNNNRIAGMLGRPKSSEPVGGARHACSNYNYDALAGVIGKSTTIANDVIAGGIIED
jgi:hypothetical protein